MGTPAPSAKAAAPKWAATKWQDRVKILRRSAAQIEKRLYEIGAIVAMEIGKNRMEALGDVQETADLIAYACDQMEANGGYLKPMGVDPVSGYKVTNLSVLRPYGPWVVISPWNFPVALAGGPTGAELPAAMLESIRQNDCLVPGGRIFLPTGTIQNDDFTPPGNGNDTIGLYDPATSLFYLRNSNSTGMADLTFGFGAAGWTPIERNESADSVRIVVAIIRGRSTIAVESTFGRMSLNIRRRFEAPWEIPASTYSFFRIASVCARMMRAG